MTNHGQLQESFKHVSEERIEKREFSGRPKNIATAAVQITRAKN